MKVGAVPMNWNERIPTVHVDDVCKAAIFLAQKEDAVGQAYNLNDDSELTYVDFFKHLAQLSGSKFVLLPPVPVKPIRFVASEAARALQTIADHLSIHSPLEADSVDYLGRDFQYSNQKLKDLGYTFTYADAKEGLSDTYDWYRDNGWI